MKIRNRFFLFLLPTMIGSIVFISTVLSYNWYLEILSNFKSRLLSSTLTYNSFARPIEDENSISPKTRLQPQMQKLSSKLNITRFHVLSDLPKNAIFHKQPYPHYTLVRLKNRKDPKTKFMTVYLPIAQSGKFLAAEASLDIVYKKFQKELLIIFLSSLTALIAMTASLILVARKIVRPIQKLNNSALAIASGQYGESISVNGPKELKELSNTLSTMSECLLENINRLKENTLIKEKTHGEYESALFLQNHMLGKVIDECLADSIALKAISFYSYDPRGFLLDFPRLSAELLQLHLAEAKDTGFEDMYQLLTDYKLFKNSNQKMLNKNYSSAQISIIKPSNLLTYTAYQLPAPFIWSLSEKKLYYAKNNYFLKLGDFIFLSNSGLASHISLENIKSIIEKVFKVFAEEGLETAVRMLKKEMAFAVRRRDIQQDMHLICLQVLY